MIFTENSGFTLVETLVAAVILFSCLGAAAVSYNTAVNLTNKLNATIDISTAVSEIRDRVKNRLLEGELEGRASFSENLEFSWQTEKRSSGRTVAGPGYDSDQSIEQGRFQITLYDVDLAITLSRHDQEHLSRYEYRELVWQETGF